VGAFGDLPETGIAAKLSRWLAAGARGRFEQEVPQSVKPDRKTQPHVLPLKPVSPLRFLLSDNFACSAPSAQLEHLR
jgi:hypothetical protein